MNKLAITAHKKLIALLTVVVTAGLLSGVVAQHFLKMEFEWSAQELATLELMIIPKQGLNQHNVNIDLAKFGQKLFFDADFSSNGEVSCASCHKPDNYFTDGESISSSGVGTPDRHTPTIVGISESSWLFWDGRKDSLWSQALGPMESPVEHGGNRTQYVRILLTKYADEYQSHFNELPDITSLPTHATPAGDNPEWQSAWQTMSEQDRQKVNRIFANLGLAIAEYEKLIQPGRARFDEFASTLVSGLENDPKVFSRAEKSGLKLFLDSEKTGCINCHNGANFTNHDFQSTGVPDVVNSKAVWDEGRAKGVLQALSDEFNCYSEYSSTSDCSELTYAKKDGHLILGAFKVPTLRNISETAPYMHRGHFEDLDQVLSYYNKAAPLEGRHVEVMPLRLLPHELKQLKAFLLTLTAPLDVDKSWLINPHKKGTI